METMKTLLAVFLACVFVGSAVTKKIISMDLTRTDSTFVSMLKQNIHPSVIEAMVLAVGNGTIPVPLIRFLDNDFFLEARFGHPGQLMWMAFDTTWVDSWIPTVTCSAVSIACAMRRKYDPNRSPFSISLNKKWERSFGTSSIEGSVYMDLLNVNQIKITNQTFAAVFEIPWFYMFNKFDGILGMNLERHDSESFPTILQNLRAQNKIDRSVFSVYLNRNPDSKKGGTLSLGGVEKRHFKGNFTYVDLVPNSRDWEIKMNNITVTTPTQRSISLCKNGCEANILTNGNAIGGPALEIDDLNKAIGAEKWFFGKYSVDCTKVQNLPKVSFSIGDRTFVLSGKDYIMRAAIGSLGTLCLSSFQSDFNIGDSKWYLGGAFISRYYTTFDADNRRIGFADAQL